MHVLIIGGTGLISTGIVKHLLEREARITFLNRGRRQRPAHPEIESIVVDRDDFPAVEQAFGDRRFDVVIDMICFRPEQAQSDIRTFGYRCGHFIFCSTVCSYGVKVPQRILVDETFAQEPISEYGKNKLLCERLFMKAHEQRIMPVTIIRPSHTYGPGLPLIDNIEADPVAFDRIDRRLPILCAGDGLGLWVSTHRDDCGKAFAYVAMNPRTFGQSYNATRDTIFTWRDYLKQIGQALGKPLQVLFMPADWIIAHDPKRFNLLREITQFHGAYSSEKAKRDIPEFRCEIDFVLGAAQTLADARDKKTLRSSQGDALYDSMVQKALGAGIQLLTL